MNPIPHPNKYAVGALLLLGTIASILSITQAIVSITSSGWVQSSTVVVISLCFTTAALAAIVMFLSFSNIKIYKEYHDAPEKIEKLETESSFLKKIIEREKETQYVLAQTFHNFSHKYRAQIRTLHTTLSARDIEQAKEVNASFQKFLIYMVDNIKEALDVLTDSKCAVCIKIIDTNSFVKTYVRDSLSLRVREEASKGLKEGYQYKENTAFDIILDDYNPDSYFMCNDLKALKSQRGYRNGNGNWSEHYNACLVVPIRFIETTQTTPSGESIEMSLVPGFLCVDNMKGGFDNTCLETLASYADHCYNLFAVFNAYNNLVGKKD